MTDETHSEVVRTALAEDDDPAILTGMKAKVAMFFLAEILAVGPVLIFIPHFDGWREVVGWMMAVVLCAVGPAIALLIPRKQQEQYRQALIDSEARRRTLNVELVSSREFSRGLMLGTGEVRKAAVEAAVEVAKNS